MFHHLQKSDTFLYLIFRIAITSAVSSSLLLTGCAGSSLSATGIAGSDSSSSTERAAPYSLLLLSRSYQNPFYQSVYQGADDAATDLNATVTIDGSEVTGDFEKQLSLLHSAYVQKPDALLLCACDPETIEGSLADFEKAGIPVICFDSGVPGNLGALKATIETNNVQAGSAAAEHMEADPLFIKTVKNTPPGSSAVVAVLADDNRADALASRSKGFFDRIAVLAKGKKQNIRCEFFAPESTMLSDYQSAVRKVLDTDHLAGIFAADQEAADALIAATDNGEDLDRQNGIYKELTVIGFDSGQIQKEAVEKGLFCGSIAQDSYEIGYQAVTMAVRAAEGGFVCNVHTGFEWYSTDNIDDESLQWMLYE